MSLIEYSSKIKIKIKITKKTNAHTQNRVLLRSSAEMPYPYFLSLFFSNVQVTAKCKRSSCSGANAGGGDGCRMQHWKKMIRSLPCSSLAIIPVMSDAVMYSVHIHVR